jgi:ABC-type nitrate/sulfonate/bicarbonate transport system substrate-binding protein
MAPLRIAWSDTDRTPYLYTLRYAAAKRGLEVELIRAGYGDFPRILLNGACELIAENYYNLQTVRAKGIPLISVAAAVNQLNEKLIVRSSVQRLEDLRGEKIAIRGRHPTDFIDALWLKDAGLADQVEIVPVDENEVGRWSMWKKVADGTCAASFVTNLFVDQALAAGLKVLPIEPYGFLGNVVLTTHRDVVAARRSEILELVRAAFDTARLFKGDAATTLAILEREPMELMKIGDPPTLARVYEIIRDELAEAPVPLPASVSNFHRMLLDHAPELADYNPLLMWDLSFAQQVIEENVSKP